MLKKTKLKIMLYFTVAYLFVFIILAIINKNYEFVYYSTVMSILLLIAVLYFKRIDLPSILIAGLTLTGFLHILGGNINLNGTRLYDIWLIQNIFRYDHFVHFIGVFVATFVAYSLLHPHLNEKIKYNRLFLSLILILIALGIGTFNELLELSAVIFLGGAERVGDYMNNAIDLFFNFLGSLTACFILMHYYKKERKQNNNIIS